LSRVSGLVKVLSFYLRVARHVVMRISARHHEQIGSSFDEAVSRSSAWIVDCFPLVADLTAYNDQIRALDLTVIIGGEDGVLL
jgi:hypothetical protein